MHCRISSLVTEWRGDIRPAESPDAALFTMTYLHTTSCLTKQHSLYHNNYVLGSRPSTTPARLPCVKCSEDLSTAMAVSATVSSAMFSPAICTRNSALTSNSSTLLVSISRQHNRYSMRRRRRMMMMMMTRCCEYKHKRKLFCLLPI